MSQKRVPNAIPLKGPSALKPFSVRIFSGELRLVFANELIEIESKIAVLEKDHVRMTALRDGCKGNKFVNSDSSEHICG